MSPRLRSALVLAGVFAFGAMTGGAAVRGLGARRELSQHEGGSLLPRQRAFLRQLDREVDLDGRQRDEVRAILASHEPEVREIRRSIAPRAAALRARTFDEVRRVLRADQQAAFERFVDRQEARAGDGEGPPDEPPPPPPPRPRRKWRE